MCLPLRAITQDLHKLVQPTEVAVAGPKSFCHEQEGDPVAESVTYVKSLAGWSIQHLWLSLGLDECDSISFNPI